MTVALHFCCMVVKSTLRSGGRHLPVWGGRALWRIRKKAAFIRKHGYAPNLKSPKRFSEKLLKRILDGHDPNYARYAMKLQAHHFVKGLGIEGLKVAAQLKVVSVLSPGDFDDLPDAFVVKSSFGSGLNEVITNKAKCDVEAVCRRFNDRLPRVRNARNESASDNVILIEAFIGNPHHGVPDDYKFHCFHRENGEFHCFIQVDSSRFGEHRQTIFDIEFSRVDLQFAGQTRHETQPEAPEKLGEMLGIARKLSAGFDYVRIDLFHCQDGIYFGEFTPFHRGGTAPISPMAWENQWGDLWDQRFPDYQPISLG